MFPLFALCFLKQQSRGDFARPPPTSDQVLIATGIRRLLLWTPSTIPEVEAPG
jgi:hypothetical protein